MGMRFSSRHYTPGTTVGREWTTKGRRPDADASAVALPRREPPDRGRSPNSLILTGWIQDVVRIADILAFKSSNATIVPGSFRWRARLDAAPGQVHRNSRYTLFASAIALLNRLDVDRHSR
ncbi:hypothetical protein L1887_60800 [Cichorium endivia]|nr:hypothetical protein L1887_60800 [Cichorium endivia]